jgi:hypothetical protein
MNRALLALLALLLLCGAASGQIARVAANCTGTTSCTTTGNAIGDLEIAYAGINATSTKPTNAAWTAVGAGIALNGTSTADSAVQMFCKVATGTNEASGTFSSTDHVVIMVYTGYRSANTATCATNALGTPSYFASTVNTTTTTETFNAITSGDASSWIVGFGYCSACTAGIATAPTGMANRSSLAGPPSIAGHDTNATAASFSSANVTLTTVGRILTGTVEIKAAQVASPTFSPDGGTFGTSVSESISDSTSGATICYTTDGSTPAATTPGTCSTGSTYSSGFSIATTATTVKALGTKATMSNSAVATGASAFTINPFLQNLASLGVSGGVPSSIPTFAQDVNCINMRTVTVASGSVYTCPFPEPTGAGNLLVLRGFADATATPTFSISDDKGEVWTVGKSQIDGSGNLTAIWYKANNVGGVRAITLTITGGNSGGFIKLSADEFYNVLTSSPVDGTPSCNSQSAATALTTGSLGTLASTGDLVYAVAFNDNVTGTTQPTVGSQSNISWNWASIDRDAGDMAEYGIYGVTTAPNPAMTAGTSSTWTACAIAFKAASAGTPPTGMHIAHLLHVPVTVGGSSTVSFSLPSSGNLLVGTWTYAATGNISAGSTTSPSNTFTALTAHSVGGTGSQIIYASNASAGNAMQGTLTLSGSVTDGTLVLADFVGANASAFDNSAATDGTFAAKTALTSCSACITPSTASGVVVSAESQTDCTATSITAPSGGLFDASTNTIFGPDGPQPDDQNNGSFMHYYNSAASAVTVTWGETCGTNNVGAWSGYTAHFLQ